MIVVVVVVLEVNIPKKLILMHFCLAAYGYPSPSTTSVSSRSLLSHLVVIIPKLLPHPRLMIRRVITSLRDS